MKLYARRLERLLSVLLERKGMGGNFRHLILFKCVINTRSMYMIGKYCRNLQTLKFKQVVVSEKAASRHWLEEINVRNVRELVFDAYCIAYAKSDLSAE